MLISMDQKSGDMYRILENNGSGSGWWDLGRVNVRGTDSHRQSAINCVYSAAHRSMGVRRAVIHLTQKGSGEVLIQGSEYRPSYRSQDMGGAVEPLYSERRQIEVARVVLVTPLEEVIAQLEDPAIEFEIEAEHYYIIPNYDE